MTKNGIFNFYGYVMAVLQVILDATLSRAVDIHMSRVCINSIQILATVLQFIIKFYKNSVNFDWVQVNWNSQFEIDMSNQSNFKEIRNLKIFISVRTCALANTKLQRKRNWIFNLSKHFLKIELSTFKLRSMLCGLL